MQLPISADEPLFPRASTVTVPQWSTVYIVFRSVPRVLTCFWSKPWVPLESAYGWQSMQTFALRDLPELANRRWQKRSVCCSATAVCWSFRFNWVSFTGSAVFRVCFLDDVHFISLLYGTEASGGRWNSPSSQWTSRSAHPAIGGLCVCVCFFPVEEKHCKCSLRSVTPWLCCDYILHVLVFLSVSVIK